jgi:hypothetical protein
MDGWEGWDFQRFYLLFVAVAFVLLGTQVFFFHWRAAFAHRSMYLPVIAAPLLAVAALAAAVTRDGAVGWIAVAVFAIGVLGGLFGVLEHARGVLGRVGGFSLRNIVAGPPTLLPLTFAAVAFSAGLAISGVGREAADVARGEGAGSHRGAPAERISPGTTDALRR